MLKLDVILEDTNNGKQETMHLVAKKMPTLKMIQEIFNIQVTYKKEVAFYMKMVPALQEFQREMGVKNVINCFARCYGARISLNRDSDTVDEDAALILENLHSSGKKLKSHLSRINLKSEPESLALA
nr:unnamed protein product [Callosobruchus analis]